MQRYYSGSGLLTDLGGKILNKTIDLLPIELHIPGYQYCGPGTKLSSRLARGDPGINKLDAACKQHDIAYSRNQDSKSRSEADRVLAERAWQRVTAGDASAGEKAAAYAVTNLMKLKSKFGGGGRRRRRRRPTRRPAGGRGLYLKTKKGQGLQVRKKKTSTRCRRVR